MRSIERLVCGCDYGATSWTTRHEAERIGALLGLRPGVVLLDVGAGAGWPGLYLARTFGCDVTLVDLPFAGLRIAARRALDDRAPSVCRVVLADAAALPFRAASFDAISHSDLLCCLRDKRGVLKACRRVIRSGGRMVFSVISIAPGLCRDDYRRAVANGPEFIESDADYPTLLEQTGWSDVGCRDVSLAYAASMRRQLRAEEKHRQRLEALTCPSEVAERLAGWVSKLAVLGDGLLRRHLFIATAGPA